MRRVVGVPLVAFLFVLAIVNPAAAATDPVDSLAPGRIRVTPTLVGLAADLDGGRVDLSANGQFVLFDRTGTGLGLFDTVRRQTVILGGDGSRPFAVSDSGGVALYTSDGQPIRWERSTGQTIALPTDGGLITDMAMSQSGAVVAYTEQTSGGSGVLRVWTSTRVRSFSAAVNPSPGPDDRDVYVTANGQRVLFRFSTGVREVAVASGTVTFSPLTTVTGINRDGSLQVLVPDSGARFTVGPTTGGTPTPVEYPAPAGDRESGVAFAGDGGSVIFASNDELYRWHTNGDLEYLQPSGAAVLGTPQDASITGRFVLLSRPGATQGILEVIDLDGPVIPIVTTESLEGPQLSDQIRRLYLAYFDREPDPGGLREWMVARARGGSLQGVSSAFAASTEFQNEYGSLSDEEFVELVYLNVLGRPAEPAGRTFWLGQLAAGMSRGRLMTEFSEGPEFRNRTLTTTPALPLAHRIERLYQAYFRRGADQPGLDYWLERLTFGAGLGALSNEFVRSDEFQNTYGSLSDEEFIDLVYRNVLDRDPDEAGRAFWLGQLSSGSMSRGTVMVGFSESAEFIIVTDTMPS